jgi:hypothetical protein
VGKAGADIVQGSLSTALVHIAGRWFAVWTDLDEPPTLPDHLRVRLVRIDVNAEQPADIALYDV